MKTSRPSLLAQWTVLFSGCLWTAACFTPLNITALSSVDGYSVIQCWQLASVPVEAMSAINYAVGGSTIRATWSIIEPRTTVGEAWAPTVQLSMILSGLVRITSPSPTSSSNKTRSTETTNASISIASAGSDSAGRQGINASAPPKPLARVAYLMPGTARSSLLIAADLKSTSFLTGHYTEFPTEVPTILVQVPFVDNKVPDHVVLHEGPCK